MGLTPHEAAKDASAFSRSGLSPTVIRRVTALSGPMPTGMSSCGARRPTSRQALIQLIEPPGELLDALGEHAQGRGGLGHRLLVAPAVVETEARAGAEQLAVAQAEQPFPHSRVGDDQNGLELVDRLSASLDRGVLGEFGHPGAVHRAVAGFRPGPGAATEHGPRSSPRIERIRLPEQTASRAVGPDSALQGHRDGPSCLRRD
ncbi:MULTISPECIES: hypothetical protein [Streptomyces]|uniref:hypothetical protein n=1 Tax=Streptomyces TaxID=1883 RepID=UPI0031D0C2BC